MKRKNTEKTGKKRRFKFPLKFKKRPPKTLPPNAECHNCGTRLEDTYCHHCGQNYFKGCKRTLVDLTLNALENMFSLDNKIFKTIVYLLFFPGRLTKEYLNGRIVSYVHPSKLFWFITIVFFAFLSYQLEFDDEGMRLGKSEEQTQTTAALDSIARQDSVKIMDEVMAGLSGLKEAGLWTEKDSLALVEKVKEASEKQTSPAKKLNIQLPKSEKLKDTTARTNNNLTANDDDDVEIDKDKFISNFRGFFFAYSPYVSFLLIPFFAFLLFAFFYKKDRYYVDHMAFALHFHSFLFLLFLFILILYSYWKTAWLFALVLFLILPIYFIRSLWVVYRPKVWSIIWKTALIMFIYLLVTLFITVGFFVLFAWKEGLL